MKGPGLTETFEEYLERCWTQQLVRETHEALSYYRIRIPTPVFFLTRDSQRYGVFDPQRYAIGISRQLIEQHPWDIVLEVLKHELAHALVYQQYGHDDAIHGAHFAKACERLGVAPWARHATIELDPAAAMAAHRELDPEEEKLLRRVEKLLSLAASGNENEASLAMQRARELCARHHLESLAAHKKQDYTYVVVHHRKKQIATWQWSIFNILGEYFFVNCISRNLFDAKDLTHYKVVDIMGTRENVQMAEYAYWFLYQQLPVLFDQFRQGKGAQPRNARNSFYMGVLRGFTEKLKKQQQELVLNVETRKQTELVLVAEAELQNFVRGRFPSITGGSGRSVSVSEEAYNSGKDRGRELTLHRGLHQQHSGGVRLLR
jgi:predicted SprT family Zn-dependent metalloprotease